MPANVSLSQWFRQGEQASYVRATKSPGQIVGMLEVARPAGDTPLPPLSDLILFQDQLGGSRVSGNSGGGHFNVISEQGAFFLGAPNFAHSIHVERNHLLRSLAFPLSNWQTVLDEASEGQLSVERLSLYKGFFHSPTIRSAFKNLWVLADEEGAPSRLLVRAAGCEILAEICRLSGAPFAPVNGGLAPWAQRRCVEMMRVRLSEDISLDELAAEAKLSPFHFARMFKQSVGVPPRVYLTQLRMEKACELLRLTELSMNEIALEVGYSSGQVLARTFIKYQRRSPSEYRRLVRV
ncbi:AraC family transcriptional regulator [Paucibacter sp. M5-1]|uniref:AraC family transcriptional regulator n=1 Tax=Paucibacter sp. M5-1 TaxID=3015998 RepID=UPI0022B8E69E|nr:AraC family transcriptional regulator [Paucibacter sp. M5-1]MCZ7880495.1 AraC family transcriptional regulator [Paucibacter sp. M5-1]